MKSQGKDTTEKVRRMKELKKLSLKEELDREAEKKSGNAMTLMT